MTSSETKPALDGLRVMVVEDELLLAMELEEHLQEEGCTVIGPVARPVKALRLLETEHPDAAVLDLNLNGERSTAVADALVERGVPFVVVTGYVDMPFDEPALRSAPRLGKPFRSEDLIRMLTEACGNGRRADHRSAR